MRKVGHVAKNKKETTDLGKKVKVWSFIFLFTLHLNNLTDCIIYLCGQLYF